MARKKKLKVKVGRPRKTLTAEQIEAIKAMLSVGCSVEEVSSAMSVSRPVLYANFKTAIKNGMDNFKCSLKRSQAKKALDGSDTMLIWLGKQYLGQKDKSAQEITAALAGPVVVSVVRGLDERIAQITEEKPKEDEKK